MVQTDGDPTVVDEFGNESEQGVRDDRGGHPADSVLVERAGGAHLERCTGEAGHGTDEVRSTRRGGVDAVGREARNAVHGMDFHLHTIALGIRGRDETGAVVTGSIVVRGERIEIAGRSIVTAEDRLVEGVTDAVSIGVLKTIAVTVVFRLGIDTRSILDGQGGVVVARCRIGTTRTADEITGAIVVSGGGVVVAGRGIGTSSTTGILT